jgi:hypothetical protein
LTGEYRPQGLPNAARGTFQLTVTDGGEPGSLNGDTVEIHLSGGLYNGYTNAGVIQGGNIQID